MPVRYRPDPRKHLAYAVPAAVLFSITTVVWIRRARHPTPEQVVFDRGLLVRSLAALAVATVTIGGLGTWAVLRRDDGFQLALGVLLLGFAALAAGFGGFLVRAYRR